MITPKICRATSDPGTGVRCTMQHGDGSRGCCENESAEFFRNSGLSTAWVHLL